MVYGAEAWQIPTREISEMLSTEMDVLRSARKSRTERKKMNIYRGADKSLARPGGKQATATADFEFHISYL